MENEILEATLVESEDESESPESSSPKRAKIIVEDRGSEQEESDPGDVENAEIVISGASRKKRPSGGHRVEDDDDIEDAEDLEDSDDDISWKDKSEESGIDDAEPEVKKARIVDEPRKRKEVKREGGDDSVRQLQIAVIGIVAIIVLAAFYFLVIREGDESNTVVNVPALRKGDEGRYSISGSIDIKDAQNDPIGGEIISGKIDLGGSSMNVKVEGIKTVTDGYFNEYSALKTYTLSTWKVDGWVDTESYGIVDIDGSIQINSNAYRNGDTILLTELDATTHIEARSKEVGFYSKDIDSKDTLRTYSSDSGDLQASLDEVIHQPNLEKGMSGEFSNDDVEYEWEVTGNDKVYGTHCVVVKFTVHQSSSTDIDIESQSIKLYLSSKHPIPVKTDMEVIIISQGRVTVKYTMTMNYFKQGSTELVIPEDEIEKISPYRDQRTMGLFPPTGTRENSSISYELKDAHEKALDKSGLQSYLDSHSDAYLAQGIYNETDGPVWNLTYSYPDADMGYVVLVTESKVDDKGEMKLGDAGSALEVNVPAPGFVQSWAGAEQILKHDDEVKENCFSGEKINLYECNFGVRTRLYQPSVDLVSMFASAPRVDYGFTVAKDDEFAAGVDADTGQLLFVATHDGPELF